MPALTAAQHAQYRRDGYIIVEGMFGAAAMDAARAAMDEALYSMPFERWQAGRDAGEELESKDGVVHNAVNGEGLPVGARSQFPTGVAALDRLIEDDGYLDALELLSGGVPLRYCNAHLFGRAGATDTRHPETGPWDPDAPAGWPGFHMDHGTNSRLPPADDFELYGYINSAVYLHDVEDGGAPMLVVAGSHAQAPALCARLFREAEADAEAAGGMPDLQHAIRTLAPPAPAVGRKGAALFYSSYLLHAAQPFRDKRVQRAFWTLSVCRADCQDFNKLSDPWAGPDAGYMRAFAETCTSPRVMALFDTPAAARARAKQPALPPPGHSYYTGQTLGLLERWLPDVDLGPYRATAATPAPAARL
jgi:hypothetical protein